jgi:hypothetical protein
LTPSQAGQRFTRVNIIPIAEEDLEEAHKQLVEKAMEEYKRACLLSFSATTRGKVIKKKPLPTPRQITITKDLLKFQ